MPIGGLYNVHIEVFVPIEILFHFCTTHYCDFAACMQVSV